MNRLSKPFAIFARRRALVLAALGVLLVRAGGLVESTRLPAREFASVAPVEGDTTPKVGAAATPRPSAVAGPAPARGWTPRRPKAPTFADAVIRGYVGRTIRIQARARTFVVHGRVVDARGVEVARATNRVFRFTPVRAGTYAVTAVAINGDGVSSRPSRPLRIEVREIPALVRAPAAAATMPASPLDLDAFGVLPGSDYLGDPNLKYQANRVTLSGALTSYQSSEQLYRDRPVPTEGSVSVKARHWFGDTGVELAGSTTLIKPSLGAGGVQSDDAHARAYRRFTFRRATNGRPELQASVFLGAGMHRASSDKLYSPRYELLQTGFSLELPVLERLAVEVEVSYAFGRGGSEQYAGDVGVAYYLDQRWALEVGYGARFFQTRRPQFSPAGTPFRDGAIQTTVGLRYAF